METSQAIYLETPRILMRRLTEDDAVLLYKLDSDPEVMHYLTGGVPHSLEFIRDKVLPRYLSYYSRFADFGFWAAIEKASDDFMGWFHFRPHCENPEEMELGYRLMKAYWGRGFATEGSRALIEKGFQELGVSKVVATTMDSNARSRRVMEKVGLRFEREFAFPGEPLPGWSRQDCREVKYGLTRVQWLESHS